jgi:hypothetical protein
MRRGTTSWTRGAISQTKGIKQKVKQKEHRVTPNKLTNQAQ